MSSTRSAKGNYDRLDRPFSPLEERDEDIGDVGDFHIQTSEAFRQQADTYNHKLGAAVLDVVDLTSMIRNAR